MKKTTIYTIYVYNELFFIWGYGTPSKSQRSPIKNPIPDTRNLLLCYWIRLSKRLPKHTAYCPWLPRRCKLRPSPRQNCLTAKKSRKNGDIVQCSNSPYWLQDMPHRFSQGERNNKSGLLEVIPPFQSDLSHEEDRAGSHFFESSQKPGNKGNCVCPVFNVKRRVETSHLPKLT